MFIDLGCSLPESKVGLVNHAELISHTLLGKGGDSGGKVGAVVPEAGQRLCF